MPVVVIWLMIVVPILMGWVFNIMALVNMNWDNPVGIEAVLRIIGIIFAPLGAVMGWFV